MAGATDLPDRVPEEWHAEAEARAGESVPDTLTDHVTDPADHAWW
jgi:hypothetical protein